MKKMKKTIGIVSFVNSNNYGAILQAVALQEELKRLGFEAMYINYASKSYLKGFKKLVNLVWSQVRLSLGYRTRLKRTNAFKNFFLSLSNAINSFDDLSKLPIYDYYMVGSDQVWHPKFLLPSNGFYLLKFAPKNSRKISYASSFGSSSIPSDMKNVYRSELSAFERLSVREKHGANFLSSIGLESSIVLDPSLLLDKEDWGVFFNKNKIVPEPYIFCYVMDGDHKGAKYIQLVSEQINNFNDQQYKIIVVGDKEYKKLIRGYNLVTNAGPSEFLSLIYNAAYVVTNSFHGTCFSVNFNKQFVSVLQRENALNIRITDFLESVSLTDRLLYTDENVDQVNLLEIDYEKVNNALSSLIDKSKSFLNEALECSK